MPRGVPDYSRVCADCVHLARSHKMRTRDDLMAFQCTLPRHVITGQQVVTGCQSMRARGGVCGPEGRLFEAAAVATRLVAAE